MDIKEIFELLPHRFPFLLVDRIKEFSKGEYIVCIKNCTINEPFFQGHFPNEPIMPGVLILEAMAQAGILFAKKTDPALKDALMVFAGIDRVKFRRPVCPGDQLELRLSLIKQKALIWKMKGEAIVDGNIVTEAELMAAIQKDRS